MTRESKGAASGLPARGYTWEKFREGNQVGATHGAYSMKLSPEVEEVAADIRANCPGYAPSDEYAVKALSVILIRISRAEAALAEADERGASALGSYVGVGAKLNTLRQDLRGWINSAERYFSALAMTPTARARMGWDVVQARRAMTVVELHAMAESEEDVA